MRRLARYKPRTLLRSVARGNPLTIVMASWGPRAASRSSRAAFATIPLPPILHVCIYSAQGPRPVSSLDCLAECATGDAQRGSSRTPKPRENFRAKRSLPSRCGGRDGSAEPWRGEIARNGTTFVIVPAAFVQQHYMVLMKLYVCS